MNRNLFFPTILSLMLVSALSAAPENTDQQIAAKPAPSKWFVSPPDLALKLPVLTETKQKYTIQISRKYDGAEAEKLLRKAEAIYPYKNVVVASVNTRLASEKLLKEIKQTKALWWYQDFDGVRVPFTITSGAVMYYRNLIQQFRKGDFSGSNGIKMISADLKYESSIRRVSEYTLEDRTFKNVYVAQMHLNWGQYCGSICAMDFDRQRTVIFEDDGNIMIYGDGPKTFEVS